MKNIISCILSMVIIIIFVCACGPAKITKITGVVKRFESNGSGMNLLNLNPKVTFTDGRFFVLKDMPEKTIAEGSEIIIYYHGRNDNFIFNDSVIVIKPAPLPE